MKTKIKQLKLRTILWSIVLISLLLGWGRERFLRAVQERESLSNIALAKQHSCERLSVDIGIVRANTAVETIFQAEPELRARLVDSNRKRLTKNLRLLAALEPIAITEFVRGANGTPSTSIEQREQLFLAARKTLILLSVHSKQDIEENFSTDRQGSNFTEFLELVIGQGLKGDPQTLEWSKGKGVRK